MGEPDGPLWLPMDGIHADHAATDGSGGCDIPGNLVVNGEFEGDGSPWTFRGSAVLSHEATQCGGTSARLGGVQTGFLQQAFLLPAATTPHFEYWLRVDTQEPGNVGVDFMVVEILDDTDAILQTLATISNRDQSSAFVMQGPYDLSALVLSSPRTIKIRFRCGTLTSSNPTYFRVDSVEAR
jgi:hypothetical protein